jgi:uncharacterized lipoprotein YmbA/predicted small secreted protein
MRHHVILLLASAMVLALTLAGCMNTPRPFEHDIADVQPYRPALATGDAADVTVEIPANMPQQMAERLAAALAIELQSYGIVAALQPARAPLRITGAMTSRDAESGSGIEIAIDWYLLGGGKVQGPIVSTTTTQPNDYAAASDALVSRIAQQAAPRVVALMGRTPNASSRSLGAVAAGVMVPEAASDPAVQAAAAAPGALASVPRDPKAPPPPAPPPPQVKVMVGSITGAPSDGDKQLLSGMRRALGSSKIVVMDKGGSDTFAVTAAVSLAPIDDRSVQLTIKWTLKDPAGKDLGNVEQSNAVPIAATRGSWAGFGDIVASAAVDGVLELLEKALNRPR